MTEPEKKTMRAKRRTVMPSAAQRTSGRGSA